MNDHLRALEKKGYLQREDMKSRALRPVDTVGQTVDVPVLGKVAAGQPLLAVRNYEDTVRVDRFFIGQNREVFALRVKGDSMIEAGIFDGDYVFVRKQMQANAGEIVVAMIEDEATVKRYYPEGDTIRFQPANASMKAHRRAQAGLEEREPDRRRHRDLPQVHVKYGNPERVPMPCLR